MTVAHPARARIATVVAAAALVTGVAVPVLALPTGAAPLRILAVPDAYAVMTNSQIAKGARLGVLGNDVDPNPGATPSAAIVTNPGHGTVVLMPTGKFFYTPKAGFAGHDQFRYRVTDDQGATSNPTTVRVTVVTEADPRDGPYWPGLDFARGVAMRADGRGGYVLDAFGGLHPFGAVGYDTPTAPSGGPYWPGWDIARGVVLLPNDTGGYVLDGFGGLHPFTLGNAPPTPAPDGAPYWPGWDIARGVTIVPLGLSGHIQFGGYVGDGLGFLHPFSIGAQPLPPRQIDGFPAQYYGFAVRGTAAVGYVGGVWLDSSGFLLSWSNGNGRPGHTDRPLPIWPRPADVARGVSAAVPLGAISETRAVTVDKYGGLHAYVILLA